MAYDPSAYPQDTATGLQDTIDWMDAGAFAWLAHNPNATGYVVDGFEFTPDWANDIVNVASGVAVIEQSSTLTNDHSADGGDPQLTLQGASFRIQRGPSGDLPLNSGVNTVWVAVDHVENNKVDFHINATGTPPDDPHIEIGTLDTSTQTTTRSNPHPYGTFNGVLVTPEGN